MSKTVENLRAALNDTGRLRFKSGTVVRWTSGIYHYAALYTGGKWWLTGTGRWYGGNMFSSKEFVDTVLADAENIEVAKGWEKVDEDV